MSKKGKQSPLKGFGSGFLAGAVASAAMDGYWWATRNIPGARPEQRPKPGDENQQKKEPSTQIMADRVSEAATGHEVPRRFKGPAGVAVHYSFGAFWGGVYGALAARQPRWRLFAGLLYGVLIWLFLDEIGLRALRVAPDPTEVPLKTHLQALGAHFAYGSALGLVTSLLLRLGQRGK